jgi:transposase-like protein
MSEATFTPQQIAALDALSTGATLTEAAGQAGVHRNTIANWRRESSDFQTALANAQYDRALYFREKAEAMADLAFDALRSVLSDPKASPSVRLKAALAVINLIGTQMQPQKKVAVTAADILDAPPPVNPARGLENLHKSAQSEPVQTIRREQPKVGRNELCPCGSGLKYKRCCADKPFSSTLAAAA